MINFKIEIRLPEAPIRNRNDLIISISKRFVSLSSNINGCNYVLILFGICIWHLYWIEGFCF